MCDVCAKFHGVETSEVLVAKKTKLVLNNASFQTSSDVRILFLLLRAIQMYKYNQIWHRHHSFVYLG
mgnify:CR=1 FL=1